MQKINSAEYDNRYSVMKNKTHLGILLDVDSTYLTSQDKTECLCNELSYNHVAVSSRLKDNSSVKTRLPRWLKKISSSAILELSIVKTKFINANRRNKLNRKKTSKESRKITVTAFEFEKHFLLALSGAWGNVLHSLTFDVSIINGRLVIKSRERIQK